jgi:hypothetical protein
MAPASGAPAGAPPAPGAAPAPGGQGQLPVVQQGEALEQWLARAVPVLMQQEGLDQATAQNLATQAWNVVNQGGGGAGAPAPGAAPAQPGQAPAGDPFAASGEETPVEDEELPADEEEAEGDFPPDPAAEEDEEAPFPPNEQDKETELEEDDLAWLLEDEEDDELPADDEALDEDETELAMCGPKHELKQTDTDDLDLEKEEDDLPPDPGAAPSKKPADKAPDFGKPKTDETSLAQKPVVPGPADDPTRSDLTAQDALNAVSGGMEWDDEETWGKDVLDQSNLDDMGMPAEDDGAAFFWQQVQEFGQSLIQALQQNGNLSPEQASFLVDSLSLSTRSGSPDSASMPPMKAATMASMLETSIHQHFTMVADSLRGEGRLTRQERIALSSCIGDALKTFLDCMRAKCGQAFMNRSPFAEVDLSQENGSTGAMEATGTPSSELAEVGGLGEFSFAVSLPPAGGGLKSLPAALLQDHFAVKLFEKGFTYEPVEADEKLGNFAIFPFGARSCQFDGLTEKTVAKFVTDNADIWDLPNAKLAVWGDDSQPENTGTLDISIVAESRDEIIDLARRHGAKFYLDLDNQRLVPVSEEAQATPAVKAQPAEEPLDRDTLLSIYMATKGFIGPKFSRKRYAALDSGFANTVKMAADRNRVEGYLMLWGDPNRRDLSGEFFTPRTEEVEAIFKAMGGIPALYHHAFDNVMKSAVVGVIDTMQRDDAGVWVEAQIKKAEEYQKFIKPLVETNKLGWSSGTLPLARRVDAKTGEILRWPCVEGSMTYAPAEWRMVAEWPIQPLKGAFDQAGLASQQLARLVSPEPTSNQDAVRIGLGRLRLLELEAGRTL